MPAPIITPTDLLTREFRRAQAELGLTTARRARTIFSEVDLRNSRDVGRASREATTTILAARQRSILLGQDYYRQARRLNVPRNPGVAPVQTEPDRLIEDRVQASITQMASGRITQRSDERGYEAAAIRARTEVAGASIRHTLNGGREVVRLSAIKDDRARGFVRITAEDDRVCAFCSMLASREDYKGNSFEKSDARFAFGGNPLANAKVHDACRCILRPVFYGEMTPASTARAISLWYDLSEGSGRQALNSYRRRYEAMLRGGTDVWSQQAA